MSQLPEDWKSQSTNHVRKDIYGISTVCLPSFSIHSKCNTLVRRVYGTRVSGLTLTVKKHPNFFTEQSFLIETRFWKVNKMCWMNCSLLQTCHRVLMHEGTVVTSELLENDKTVSDCFLWSTTVNSSPSFQIFWESLVVSSSSSRTQTAACVRHSLRYRSSHQ